ncbi:hypothetical protein FUAX_19670 [Fulvitalea axinellae]|uniref:Uncharacterized protein n=2 Tax=Fulvitalea axinellae TaxID=1182444 RepID=A0AAU9DEZ8_9BACT|nr:hypothetical protein FUAX_19670 [Fulvitalea axinellae]
MMRDRTIQMAGHKADFLKLRKRIVKRVDPIEADQYRRFLEMGRQPSPIQPKIPAFAGPFGSIDELKQAIEPSKHEDIDKAWPKEKPGYHYVILDDVTGGHEGAKLHDLKIGTKTASYTEQRINQKRWVPTALAKAFMHQIIMDPWVSDQFGFRDEDSHKQKKWGKKGNLSQVKMTVSSMSVQSCSRVLDDVQDILEWARTSPTVYVGSSILIVANDIKPELSRAVLIDFAHPISEEMGFPKSKVDKYREAMLKGFETIRRELVNRVLGAYDESEDEDGFVHI